MRLYKTSDKISIKIDDIEIKVSPLNQLQKNELQGHMMKAVNGNMDEAMLSVQKAMKFCIKGISGVEYEDEGGDLKSYELEFEEGMLSDDCIDDLLNLPVSNKISSVCSALLGGIPNEILDADGKPIEGIKILKKEGKKGKSKK